jgi:hypothetical protein
MKKLFYIISIILLSIAGLAYTVNETVFSEPVNTTVGYDQSYYYYTGQAKDTIGVGDSVYTFPVRKKSLSTVLPYVYVAIDSTGGTFDTVTVQLQSKVFEDESYITRESATWNLGSDTIIVLQSDTSHISEYWRIRVACEDDTFKAKITSINFKFTQ